MDIGENLSFINFLFHFPLKINNIDFEKIKTLRQYHILNILKYYRSLDIKTIAKRLSLAHNTTSELISRMEELDLIKTQKDRNDKRRVIVSLTKKGEEAFYSYSAEINKAFSDFTDKFMTLDDREKFLNCLNTFIDIAKKTIAKLEGR